MGGSRFGFLFFSHGFSFQRDGVCVVDESVKNGVGERWVADAFVPVFEGHLCGDEGGAAVVSLFGDLEEVSSLFVRQEGCCPVVEDEEVCFGECVEEFGVASVAFGAGKLAEESGGAVILDGESFSAGCVSEGAGEVGFADAGGSGDDGVVVLSNPVAGGEGEHETFIESSFCTVVDVFEDGAEA